MSDKIHAPIGASYRGEKGLEKSVRLLGLLIGEELWRAISERATVYTPTYERERA
jgi:hypothetical protein